MYRAIRSGELPASPGGTVTFEGESYGSGVSFFHVHNQPGEGPDLHRHLRENGVMALAPDGPRGPRMRAQMGPVQLAKHAGAPLMLTQNVSPAALLRPSSTSR